MPTLMPAPLPNDGKSSTVAGLNGWQIPELNKATLRGGGGRTQRNASACTKRCRKPCSSIRRTSSLTRKNPDRGVRDNVKGYQQGLNADMVWYDNVTK